MGTKKTGYTGCLLGLAVGDAMGLAVDNKSWDEICAEYGPNGLLGYDLRNDTAEVSSHTQVAAYTANGLLVALSRGRLEDSLRYVTLALREWLKRQHFPRSPEKSPFWVSQLPQLRKRSCWDARMTDALRAETLGTPDRPINSAASCGSLTEAVAIAMFFNPTRMEAARVGTLTANSLALTHGSPEAFLSGVVLAYTVAGLLYQPECSLQEQLLQACSVMESQFGNRFPQAEDVKDAVVDAIRLAKQDIPPREGMESLVCGTALECLCGAVYACMKNPLDFDGAMILAVNHSGHSAAVAAVTGALLGARLGREALPEFYLESLEAREELEQLAEDLSVGTMTTGLFNDDWDTRYVQGMPC